VVVHLELGRRVILNQVVDQDVHGRVVKVMEKQMDSDYVCEECGKTFELSTDSFYGQLDGDTECFPVIKLAALCPVCTKKRSVMDEVRVLKLKVDQLEREKKSREAKGIFFKRVPKMDGTPELSLFFDGYDESPEYSCYMASLMFSGIDGEDILCSEIKLAEDEETSLGIYYQIQKLLEPVLVKWSQPERGYCNPKPVVECEELGGIHNGALLCPGCGGYGSTLSIDKSDFSSRHTCPCGYDSNKESEGETSE